MAFIVLVTWAAVQGSLSLWGFYQDAARRDFGHFVSSARMWRDSGVLYDSLPRVNLNPPHASIVLFTPLTWISFDLATALWIVVQVGGLAFTMFLIARELNLSSARLEWIVPITVASAMTIHNWVEGQVGAILLIGGVVAWRAVRRNQTNLASIVLGVLINFKPQLGLTIFANSWRTQLRVFLVGTAILTTGVLLSGTSLWNSWIATTRAQGLQLLPWNVSIAPMLYRAGIVNWTPYVHAGSALAIVTMTWHAARRDCDSDRRWLLWGVAMLLIAPVAWVYYAAAFLGPLISWGERCRWPLAAKVGILLWLIPLQALSWVASSPPGWKLGVAGSPFTFGAILVWLAVLTTLYQRQDPLLVKLRATS
jgi:hypothetical protein